MPTRRNCQTWRYVAEEGALEEAVEEAKAAEDAAVEGTGEDSSSSHSSKTTRCTSNTIKEASKWVASKACGVAAVCDWEGQR